MGIPSLKCPYLNSYLHGAIRIPLPLHAHVALSRYAAVCIFALLRASSQRAICKSLAPLVVHNLI